MKSRDTNSDDPGLFEQMFAADRESKNEEVPHAGGYSKIKAMLKHAQKQLNQRRNKPIQKHALETRK
jgi:hypothetical protein